MGTCFWLSPLPPIKHTHTQAHTYTQMHLMASSVSLFFPAGSLSLSLVQGHGDQVSYRSLSALLYWSTKAGCLPLHLFSFVDVFFLIHPLHSPFLSLSLFNVIIVFFMTSGVILCWFSIMGNIAALSNLICELLVKSTLLSSINRPLGGSSGSYVKLNGKWWQQ